jgi:hypothetical protein
VRPALQESADVSEILAAGQAVESAEDSAGCANRDGELDAHRFVWLNGSLRAQALKGGSGAAIRSESADVSEKLAAGQTVESVDEWARDERGVLNSTGAGLPAGNWQQRTLRKSTANPVLDLTRVPTSVIMGTESEP